MRKLNPEPVLPAVFFEAYTAEQPNVVVIDVRSEGEYEKGAFPGSSNIPLLDNLHRHKVGLAYKQSGENEAHRLAEELLRPTQNDLIDQWQELIEQNSESVTYLYCWRGGDRSRYACSWLQERGLPVHQVQGGFKSLRREALNRLLEFPDLLVVGGMTGSGKSRLLSEFSEKFFDLEGLANHRGSAFGAYIESPQPNQIQFDFDLALWLMNKKDLILVEDESRSIGRVRLPEALYKKMASSPTIVVDVPRRLRAERIYEEYIVSDLKRGVSIEQVNQQAVLCLTKIERKLGGLAYSELQKKIRQAFASGGDDKEQHCLWIEELLELYYDKHYQYSLAQKDRPVVFQGDFEECQEKIREFVQLH